VSGEDARPIEPLRTILEVTEGLTLWFDVAKYEYLFASLHFETNWIEIRNIVPQPPQTWKVSWTILRPGNPDTELRDGTLGEYQLMNELGQEGWRFVESTIHDSTIISNKYGWNDVGTPTRTRYIFEREVAE
jgi:hypothetical protein